MSTRNGQAESLDRVPPHNLDAERAVLGSVLLDPDCFDDVLDVVREPAEFHGFDHQVIFRELLALHHAGQAIDVTLLAERLTTSGMLDSIGGLDYLAEVVNAVPTATNATHYAGIVREKARLRALIAAATETIRDALDSEPSDDIRNRAQSRLDDLNAAAAGSEPTPLGECLAEAMEVIDKRTRGETEAGLSTGLSDLDAMVAGLRPKQLIVIAGRPGSGKSVLGLQLAAHATIDLGRAVLFVSLEMSRQELAERLFAARAEVHAERITSGRLDDDDRRRLVDAQNQIGFPLSAIDDTPRRSIVEIVSQARRLKRSGGLDLLVVDYLQLIEPDNSRDPRHEQVARMARRLKMLARELEIPVVCLAQLNREVEKAGSGKPKLSHLRESGSIEQDADVVILVHREEQSRPDDPDVIGQAELIVAKQRGGRTGTVRVLWQGETYRFLPLAHHCAWDPDAFQFAT